MTPGWGLVLRGDTCTYTTRSADQVRKLLRSTNARHPASKERLLECSPSNNLKFKFMHPNRTSPPCHTPRAPRKRVKKSHLHNFTVITNTNLHAENTLPFR